MIDSNFLKKNQENFLSESEIEAEINSEIINTDIGYNDEELKASTTEDLIVLRKAIFSYLKSPNLKKRNPNYLKLFKRINEELKIRNLIEDNKSKSNKKVIKKY